MSQQIDAIYDNGVFKPLAPLAMPDQARVTLIVETLSGEEVIDTVGTGDGFESALEPLLFDGPNLPADFSRADIYADHD